MDMTCLPCPISAKYCIGGKAWCRNWDVFDAETHSCVQMSYQENVIAHFAKMKEIIEWIVPMVNEIQKMEFDAFCKLYEMEIAIAFFILSWNVPCFHCLIVYGWTKMIMPIVDRKERPIMFIAFNVLAYFAIFMFVYGIWKKVNEFLSKDN